MAVALFWAFTNASLNLEEAKSTYGLIIAFAQVGAVFGSTMATQASRFGVGYLYGIGALSCLSMVLMVRGYAFLFLEKSPAQIKAKAEERSAPRSTHTPSCDYGRP